MHILRSLIPFRLPNDDLLLIYKGYIRPLVEYAVPVWHSGLTTAQTNKLEGIQKRALKLILGYRYNSYANALVMTSLNPCRKEEWTFVVNWQITPQLQRIPALAPSTQTGTIKANKESNTSVPTKVQNREVQM